jgi:hypothetical protein
MDYKQKEKFNLLNSYMIADEYIIWKGQPSDKVRFKEESSQLFTRLFFLGFSIFWCYGASKGGSNMAWLIGSPFLAFSLYLLFGRPFHVAYKRKNTYYVITNMKIMRLYNNRMETIDGRNLPQINIKGFADGFGNIYFGEQMVYRKNGKTYSGYSGGSFYLEAVPIKAVQVALDKLVEENSTHIQNDNTEDQH